MPSKLLRPNVGIYVATSDAFAGADITASGWAPTLAQITDATKVFNISPAVIDGYTLNLTDSDTNSSLSVVDNAQVNTPTNFNYEASFDGFRDANTGATSVYNKFRDLFATAPVGTKYYLVKRIGKAHDAAFAQGDLISVFGVTTDFTDDLLADGEMIRYGARFLQTGEVAVNVAIAAGTAGAGPALASTTGTKIQSNGNVGVWWVPAAAVSNESTFLASPSAAIVNGASALNLSSAIAWDGYELGISESNKIDDKGIVDKSNAKVRGFAQFAGALTFFRAKFNTGSYAGTGSASASTITITTPANAGLVEVGMAVSGTGIGVGAVVTSTNASTGVVGVSVVNSGAVSGNITFTSTYSLAFDTFKAATVTRAPGYLVTRVGLPISTAFATGQTTSVFKFIADAAMDNTEGEDSIKFMVKFQPQGLVGINVASVA